jgi:hypothetical protein
MAAAELPTPRNAEQEYLAGIYGRLGNQNGLLAAQNELLAQVLDRLPAPADAGAGPEGATPIREPAATAGDGNDKQPGDGSPASTATPARPAAKKAAAKRTTAKKGPSDG